MELKLTLHLEESVIDRAKEYASSQKRSLSDMIEAYLKSLITKNQAQPVEEIEISPYVKSLRTGVKVPADYNYKEEYTDYLAEKYK